MAKIIKELRCVVPNRAGTLAKMTTLLKMGKVNILHIAGWGDGKQAFVNLATSDNVKAKRLLKMIGITCREVELLSVRLQNQVDALNRMATKLAKAGVDIKSIQATTGGKVATVVLNTKNNKAAAKVI